MAHLLQSLTAWVIWIISGLRYFGVFICITIEGACIPLPSEVILPFAGFLVFTGRFNFFLAILMGGLGNAFGSTIMYFLGLKGGYPLVKKYGKFLLISNKDLNRAEKWFSRYGNKTVFFSQLFPVIRTYISLPSGILKIKYLPFLIYTFLGAIIWSLLLVWLGMTFGQNWKVIQVYFKKFDLAISILVFAGLAFFIYHKISKFNKLAKEKN